jgi:ATP-dependent Clp protease ATP-binding subunit ClpX
VYICDECIDLCNEIIEEELADADDVKLDELPKPMEIRDFLEGYVIGQDTAKRTLAVADALVMVVNRNRQRLLGHVLSDDVRVEEVVDLPRLRQLGETDLGALVELLLDDLVAEIDAFVADVDAGTGDELLDLLLALTAERALQQVAAVTYACHRERSLL